MKTNAVVEKTVSYIETHLNETLTLDRISCDLNYSKFYLARTFAEETGLSVYRYIKGRRLTQAARKLAETDKPIIEIAYEAQYSSQQAFTLAFSRLYSCTPQAFRKNKVYYPKQDRINTKCALPKPSGRRNMEGGRMAA